MQSVWTGMGRLTADPVLQQLQNTQVVNFSLAVERDYKNRDGVKDSDFLECEAWGQEAQFIKKYFQKGQMAIAVGRPKQQTWQDNEGHNRSKIVFSIDKLYFNGAKYRENDAQFAEATDSQGNINAGAFSELVDDDGPYPF